MFTLVPVRVPVAATKESQLIISICALSYTDLSVFFFQAEDGIRGDLVTGVQTCALPFLGFFGMVHVLEGTSISLADNAADTLRESLSLPKDRKSVV